MSSYPVRLSKAVAAHVTAGTFSRPVRCVHAIRPRFKPAELDTLRVTSIPGPLTRELESRAHVSDLYSIGVGLQRRVAPEHEDQEADDLLQLADEISMVLTGQRLEAEPEAGFAEIEVAAPSAEHLEDHSVVTVVITVRYRVRRARQQGS